MCIVRAGDAPGFGVFAHHVVGLPAGDVHEVIGGAAGREPLVSEGTAEAVRVNVLNPGLLTSPAEHETDPGVRHVRAVVPLVTEPQPRRRRLRVASAGA